MGSRRHHVGNHTRYKVSTIGTNLAGVYIEWGVEVVRERRYATWWGGYEWRRAGSPPIFYFDSVTFYLGDGSVISNDLLQPAIIDETGYRKVHVVYAYVGNAPPPAETWDARIVKNVRAKYNWEGQIITLTHSYMSYMEEV
jgi:hypothetical protein